MRFSVFDALGLFAISITGVFGIIGIFGDELRPALRQSLVCGMFHRTLGSLAEPPYADDDGRNNDHGRNNRNNHIRIHDSSLKSATDTPAPPRGRTTNVRFARGIRCSAMQGIDNAIFDFDISGNVFINHEE